MHASVLCQGVKILKYGIWNPVFFTLSWRICNKKHSTDKVSCKSQTCAPFIPENLWAVALAAKGLILVTVGWVCIRITVMCVHASILFTGLCVCVLSIGQLSVHMYFSINGVHPQPRKVLQLFRLRQINNGVFVKLNKATLNMLKIAEPYITWGWVCAVHRWYQTNACRLRPDVSNIQWGIEGLGLLKGKLYIERDSSSFMWHQPCQLCKYTTSLDIQKHAIKSYSLV